MANDYIRREDAADWLKQYGQDVLHGKYKFSLMYIWKNIMDLPSSDVVPIEWIQKKIDKSIGMEHAMWSKLLRMWENEQLRKYVRNLKDDNK